MLLRLTADPHPQTADFDLQTIQRDDLLDGFTDPLIYGGRVGVVLLRRLRTPTLPRLLARTDWTLNASWFDYKCTWETINHELGDCGQFKSYRKGEWLTKERSGYSDDFVEATSDYHNTLGLQNDTPTNLQWFEVPTSQRGGQWTNAANAGDPTTLVSFANGYVYAQSDATNLYNRPNQWTPANAATSKTANRFKHFSLVLLANPAINGNLATVTSTGGQTFGSG